MSEVCTECRMPEHNPCTCLQNLRLISQQAHSKLIVQQQMLEFYENNSKSLLQINETQDIYKDVSHPQACCDSCYELPLMGTRFKCKKCPNFDLCFKCRHTFPHEHESFFAITTANLHYNKNCTECFGQIPDVIYKCQVCPSEICNECYIIKGHSHENVFPVLPFDIKVEAFCNRSGHKCKNGDQIFIQFVIYNSTKQAVTGLVVQEEDCPFAVVKREVKMNLKEREIFFMEVGGVVKAPCRTYNTKFRFLETGINEIIGNEIVMKFVVTDGIFSSFFKG